MPPWVVGGEPWQPDPDVIIFWAEACRIYDAGIADAESVPGDIRHLAPGLLAGKQLGQKPSVN